MVKIILALGVLIASRYVAKSMLWRVLLTAAGWYAIFRPQGFRGHGASGTW